MFENLPEEKVLQELDHLNVEGAAKFDLAHNRLTRNQLTLRYFPDTGPFHRGLYRKHLEFFRAGKVRRTRAFLAANRVGKSIAGAYEQTLHLTGRYPHWWKGRRFYGPTKTWSCGLNNLKVRDSLQKEMLGQITRDKNGPRTQLVGLGTGMIPAEDILATRPKPGVADAIDTVHVQHYDAAGNKDGVSVLVFKSYDQGVDAFSAEAIHSIHLDEEPDQAIFTECSVRLATTGGSLMITATPLLGMTEMVVRLMESYRTQVPLSQPSVDTYVVMASWDDAPHLTEEDKKEIERHIPPYQRDARMKGIPQMGAGAIYPVPESEITVDPFDIPDSWPRCFGLDVGNKTAAVWLAHNRDAGVYYLYREYYREGDLEAIPPSLHASIIKGVRNKDAWIPGVVDPAARGRSQTDGQNLLQMYTDLGLNLTPARNAVESGLQEVLDAYTTGRLKIFKPLQRFWQEFRLYRRDAKGKVVKELDHVMDAKRYAWVSGRDIMRTRPEHNALSPNALGVTGRGPQGWMG